MPTIIDWYKLTQGSEYENADIRLADVVLNHFGIAFQNIEAFISDDEDSTWKLAITN